MEVRIRREPGIAIAVFPGDGPVIDSVAGGMDLMGEIWSHQAGAAVLPRQRFSEDFFMLRTGIAGEILQKFTNYHLMLGIVGDFSAETSKALRDFIYECNQGKTVCFLPEEEQAIRWIAARAGSLV